MARISRRRHVPNDGFTRRLWIYFAVFAFIVVDILLVLWAVSDKNAPLSATSSAEPSAQVEPVETTPSPTPSATAEPTEPTVSTITTAVPSTRIITALNDKVAWRAETGPCPETPASPEYTLDGGLTWTATDATGPTDVTAIQSITVEDDGIASMIGLSGEDCSPEFIKTFVAGDNYRAYPDQLEDAWYVDPFNRSVIQTPNGEMAAPCTEVIAMAIRDSDSLAILCADQVAYTTDSGAETWSGGVSISGAANLTVSETAYRFGILGKAECAGVQISTLSLEGIVAGTGCLVVSTTVSDPSSSLGFSEANGSLWVWVGDVLGKTLDGGATWEK